MWLPIEVVAQQQHIVLPPILPMSLQQLLAASVSATEDSTKYPCGLTKVGDCWIRAVISRGIAIASTTDKRLQEEEAAKCLRTQTYDHHSTCPS